MFKHQGHRINRILTKPSSDRRSQDPPPVLQERHGRLKDHQRHGPRKLARRRTRPYDVKIDNADRPDQPHYNKNFKFRTRTDVQSKSDGVLGWGANDLSRFELQPEYGTQVDG